jgi:pyruvate/2-oxoglutarate dehydrogenase complex dihydrolipoamide acyltransferase (E2) component
MSSYIEMKMQRLSANDDEYIFVEQLVKEGAQVVVGDVVANIESAKTVFEIEASAAGFVFFMKRPQDKLMVGETIAVISSVQTFDKTQVSQCADSSVAAAPTTEDEIYARFTERARELVASSDIDVGYFRDFDVITAADVEAYLSGRPTRAV